MKLQCSNCWTHQELDLNYELPERCSECGMLVGWLPTNFKLSGSSKPDSAQVCRKPVIRN